LQPIQTLGIVSLIRQVEHRAVSCHERMREPHVYDMRFLRLDPSALLEVRKHKGADDGLLGNAT